MGALKNTAALITEETEDESKSAILGKEVDIPVLTKAKAATRILKSGTIVTVDASKGCVYSGIKKDIPED